MPVKLSDQPHELSYYTTWWLESVPSMSTQNSTLSRSDDSLPIDEHEEKQKTIMNETTSTCCIPIKAFRLKWKKQIPSLLFH
ncbi:unnamed protein product [Rotaria sp. Silwood2]|nr:unnamed protein product [Rotaria sp. Silwood2]CAF4223545.1 unnamed protein product [Rotaria sp. Silwood2]